MSIGQPNVLVAGLSLPLLLIGAGGALAQSRPAGAPAAPSTLPQVFAPRAFSVERAPAAVVTPEIVESRPGGCPEGPPCPGEAETKPAGAAPEACGEGEDCGKEK